MKAVVLAAGEGVRLRPLTEKRPKNLIQVACKPILEYLIQNLVSSGVTEILLVVGAKTDSIQRHFGNGKGLGASLGYVVQPEVLGTANAVGMAKDFVQNEPFLALYGDIFVLGDAVKRVLDSFRKDTLGVSMAVSSVSDPQFYGIAKLEGEYVRSLVEKPSPEDGYGNMANAGIFAFPPKIFTAIESTPESKRGEYEITDSVGLLIHSGTRVRAVELAPGSWKDIGRPWDLLEANEIALKDMKPNLRGEIEDGTHLAGSIVVKEHARIRSGSYIEGPVCIAEGAEIGPNCYIRSHTSIGRNVRVGNGCEIKNSIVMDDTKIPHLSYVGDSIIGERCNFGAGTMIANLRFDDKPVRMMISERLVDTGRRKLGAVIGDDVQTGINVSIMPGVKIGSDSWIGPSQTVARDVPRNGRIL